MQHWKLSPTQREVRPKQRPKLEKRERKFEKPTREGCGWHRVIPARRKHKERGKFAKSVPIGNWVQSQRTSEGEEKKKSKKHFHRLEPKGKWSRPWSGHETGGAQAQSPSNVGNRRKKLKKGESTIS